MYVQTTTLLEHLKDGLWEAPHRQLLPTGCAAVCCGACCHGVSSADSGWRGRRLSAVAGSEVGVAVCAMLGSHAAAVLLAAEEDVCAAV